MKPSIDRDYIAANYPHLLDVKPDEGLAMVTAAIAALQHDITVLQRLAMSYRASARWAKNRHIAPGTTADQLTDAQFAALKNK